MMDINGKLKGLNMCKDSCKCLKAGSRIRIPGLVDDRVFLFRLKDSDTIAYCSIDSWNAMRYIVPSYTNDWMPVDTLQVLKDREFIHP